MSLDPENDTKASHREEMVVREIDAVFFFHFNYVDVKGRGMYTQVHMPKDAKKGALNPLELSCMSLLVSQPTSVNAGN